MARVGEDAVIVLDVERLTRVAHDASGWTPGGEQETTATEPNPSDGPSYFCPEATDEERAGFCARARRLMHAPADPTPKEQLTVVVVGLHGQRYGIDVEHVVELSGVDHITPLPCCPQHVVGIVNLRGEALTLVDVSSALDLPAVALGPENKIVVVRLDKALLGLLVEAAFDIVSLDRQALSAPTAATRPDRKNYLKGTALYRKQVLSVLDVAGVVAQANFEVDEQV